MSNLFTISKFHVSAALFYSFYCSEATFIRELCFTLFPVLDFIFTDDDIAKSETFRNFTTLNKALLFLIKLNKTAVQSVLK